MATSGTPARGAHIDDPRTGTVPWVLRRVTVTGPTLLCGDLLATAASVAGDCALDRIAGHPG